MGARTGTSLLWAVAWTWPLMAAAQMAAARIGLSKGRGLATAFRKKLPVPFLGAPAVARFATDTVNVAADLAGMADAAAMLVPVSARWFVFLFGVGIPIATVRLP